MYPKDTLCINAIRILGADAIQKANSGHPGIVLDAAPMAYTLYAEQMNHDPSCPNWDNRDRFILSAGHGSMLVYALLHIFGYAIPVEDLAQFRQWGSLTPGHPEVGHTPGVDATTGPLGQGVSMAVGMAMAEAHLAAQFNEPDYPVVDHYTYALVGDGCLQEGVSSEACSLAGTLKLNKLIVLYDRNQISIEGDIHVAFDEDVAARYRAYGWHVVEGIDGEDTQAINDAIAQAKQADAPSLLIVNTKIGKYSALEGSEKTHGEPLGEENVAALRKTLHWPLDEPFAVPQEVYDTCRQRTQRGREAHQAWQKMMERYAQAYPEKADAYRLAHTPGLPAGVDVDALMAAAKPTASRSSSGTVLNLLKDMVPSLFGGSADLAPSNKTLLNGEPYFSPTCREGRNIHFGIREFAMAAICNGMALHGGVRPYCATFMVFSDYLRHAVRLSALMKQSVLYIFTHDSIGVGEDGPTHEPIEHLASYRCMPNCSLFRPADAREVAAAYVYGLGHAGPTLLALSRQNLPLYDGTGIQAVKGAYVLEDCAGTPDVILIGTGSEVELCVKAAQTLREQGTAVRVVSMPSMEVFLRQDEAYQQSVLPKACRARVGVEAGSSFGWHAIVGDAGELVCIDHFGGSAPAATLFAAYGFTTENVVEKAKASMQRA